VQDAVRTQLAELVGRFGLDLCNDPKRCEGLLRDVCGDHKREMLALVSAARNGVGSELRQSSAGVPKELIVARLTKRLCEDFGLAEDLARWAVESWAVALGIATAKEFRFPFKCPKCGAQGNIATRLAGRKVQCPKCGVTLFIADNGREVFLAPKARTSPARTASTTGTLPAKKNASGVMPQAASTIASPPPPPDSTSNTGGPNATASAVTPTLVRQPTVHLPQDVPPARRTARRSPVRVVLAGIVVLGIAVVWLSAKVWTSTGSRHNASNTTTGASDGDSIQGEEQAARNAYAKAKNDLETFQDNKRWMQQQGILGNRDAIRNVPTMREMMKRFPELQNVQGGTEEMQKVMDAIQQQYNPVTGQGREFDLQGAVSQAQGRLAGVEKMNDQDRQLQEKIHGAYGDLDTAQHDWEDFQNQQREAAKMPGFAGSNNAPFGQVMSPQVTDWLAKYHPEDMNMRPGEEFTAYSKRVQDAAAMWRDRYQPNSPYSLDMKDRVTRAGTQFDDLNRQRADLTAKMQGSQSGSSASDAESVKKGDALLSQGNFDAAIAAYTQAIGLNPKYAVAYSHRGHAYGQKSDFDTSIADCTEAIRLDPQFAEAYNNRGFAYGSKGDFEKAIADFTEAIRLDPQNAMVYNFRGSAYEHKGDFAKAIADYTEAIRLNPNGAEAYFQRGFAYEKKGDHDKAIVDLTEAIRLNPNGAMAYHNRGVAYSAKGDTSRAESDFAKAKELGYKEP